MDEKVTGFSVVLQNKSCYTHIVLIKTIVFKIIRIKTKCGGAKF